jgi:pilin/secretion family protein with methylation motif
VYAMKTPKRIARLLRDQRGLSLVELMVATTMTLMVLGAASILMIMGLRTQPAISDQSFDIQQGRAFEDRFTRELRASYEIEPNPPPTSSTLSFDTYVRSTTCGGAPQANPGVPAIPCRVTYTCTAGACYRAEAPPSTGGGAVVKQVSGLDGSVGVFGTDPTASPAPPGSPLPNSPGYITIHLAFPANGSTAPIALDDGVDLRNR